jgi:hypothetical protein
VLQVASVDGLLSECWVAARPNATVAAPLSPENAVAITESGPRKGILGLEEVAIDNNW